MTNDTDGQWVNFNWTHDPSHAPVLNGSSPYGYCFKVILLMYFIVLGTSSFVMILPNASPKDIAIFGSISYFFHQGFVEVSANKLLYIP